MRRNQGLRLFLIPPLCPATPLRNSHRLHVNIFDTDNQQFRVPDDIVPRPSVSGDFRNISSDLAFHYNPDPFEFWITRRTDPNGTPLFDTRKASLPTTPIAPVISTDNSTALDGFPLVFEDQYLQVSETSCDEAPIRRSNLNALGYYFSCQLRG